jgi:thymidylate synthase (FAD)
MNLIYQPTIIASWATTPCTEIAQYILPFEPEDWDSVQAIPEIAGRVCYQSFSRPRPGGNRAYMERILSEGHGSVLEHATVGFIIHGVSRSLTHELIRHRAGTAVSELS